MLREFGRIVVEKVTERIDDLGEGSGEIDVVLWQLFRERDEGIKCPCLLSREKGDWRAGERGHTLKDGM